ncbi:MAG: histidine phosphatase family protein [Candidatus Micrarchaeota archaeon]
MTRIILSRHGITRHNIEGRVQGSLETPLHRRGVVQARLLGRRLKGERITAAYSSPLERAVRTAEEVLRFHKGVGLVKLEGLRERGFGVAEGLTYAEIRKYPGILSEQTGTVDHRFKPEKGESWGEVRARAMRAMRGILRGHAGETVLVVAHGGTNRMILAGLTGLQIQKAFVFRQHNACINIIEVGKGGVVRVETLNDTAHLER